MKAQPHQPSGSPNKDPITGESGAHPVGVGVGTTGGAAAGAAIGSVAGPVGTVIGGIAGGVAGGLAGKAAAEAVDPTVENAYWEKNFQSRPYADKSASYDDYAPAYRYGWESHSKHAGRKFDEVERDLSNGWAHVKGNSRIGWEKAKMAARDAWDRVASSKRS